MYSEEERHGSDICIREITILPLLLNGDITLITLKSIFDNNKTSGVILKKSIISKVLVIIFFQNT